jgi:NAD(P)-dependent dehydrogenase (short-subunit alcohol dehydrogenase family)
MMVFFGFDKERFMFTVLNRSSNALPRSRVTETRIIMTGAAGAIGAATTTMLRQQGAIVVGIDKSLGEGLIQADVRDPEEVRKAVNTAVTNLGGLDVLINNAGIAAVQDTGAEPDEGAIATFEINLLGAWRITAAALPHLLATHGRVVMLPPA